MTAPDMEAAVSRETRERLTIYADLLKRWNPRINLVSRKTIPDIWTRHFEDSAQLLDLAPDSVEHWADLGAGGGFPGLVVGIIGQARGKLRHLTLVESDRRKAVFLRTVIRETGLDAQVIAERIEDTPPLAADVISARALAPLDDLLELSARHMAADGIALFPKGARWQKELEAARSKWNFTHRVDRSKTETGAVILTVKGVSRA